MYLVIMEADSSFSHEPVISVTSDYGIIEQDIKVDFLHLDSICNNYVFTKDIYKEMSQK